MSWQDILISIANIGFFLSLLPLVFTTVFNLKTLQIGVTVSAFLTSFFAVLAGIAVISLGAIIGGSLSFLISGTWFVIGIATWLQGRK